MNNLQSWEEELTHYYHYPVVLDSPILALFLIGLYDPSRINSVDVWDGYNRNEFELLRSIISHFDKGLIITPQILVETIHHLRKDKSRYEYIISKFITPLKDLGEVFIEKNLILSSPKFSTFGPTDIGLVECSKKLNSLIITQDLALKLYCDGQKIPCLSFNNVRYSVW